MCKLMPLILASASASRRAMLEAAGVPHSVVPAQVDERAASAGLVEPGEVALELARLKALEVSGRQPGDLVIGSDSVVAVDGRRFDKPAGRAEAAEHLRVFSGKPMRLTSGVALARDGAVEWSHAETAVLHVRTLSEAFIAGYLDAEWPAVGFCVGVFRIEGPGVQLFESINGNHFTILGMPLMALLGALRERGAVAA
jgi:septum formation protein